MRCFFDHQMSPKLARALSSLEGNKGIVVEHLRDKFYPSTTDLEWIKKLAEEGDWFAITKDNQIRNNPYEKKVWQESNLPIVFLNNSWKKYKLWDIAWRLVKYWPKIREAVSLSGNKESFVLSSDGSLVEYYK